MQSSFLLISLLNSEDVSSNPPPTTIIQGNKRRLLRGVVGYTTRHKINSQYYRELMLKYEEDIEKLQTEVEKAREGPSNIVILQNRRIGQSKEKALGQG